MMGAEYMPPLEDCQAQRVRWPEDSSLISHGGIEDVWARPKEGGHRDELEP
jgi:hypothetical protein